MQLTKSDLNEFKHELVEILDQRMEDKLRLNNDLIFQEMKALEYRQDCKLEAVEQRILSGVAQILDDAIVPQVSELDKRVTKLEVKVSAL